MQNAIGTKDFLIDETLQPHSARLRPEGERVIEAESHMANLCSALHEHRGYAQIPPLIGPTIEDWARLTHAYGAINNWAVLLSNELVDHQVKEFKENVLYHKYIK